MIVGTEGVTIETAEQESGTGDGETQPPNPAQSSSQDGGDADQAQQKKPDKKDSTQSSSTNDDGAGGGDGKDKKPAEDPRYPFVRSGFLADAMKAAQAAAIDLYSTAPDKVKARETTKTAYKKAVEKDGPLTAKLQQAAEKFDDLVSDLDRDKRIQPWIEAVVNGVLKQLIEDRSTVPKAVRGRAAKYEFEVADARANAKALADRYADWTSPAEKIAAQVAQYSDKIDALRKDLSDPKKRDLAQTLFWFEVAPKHLQLLATEPTGKDVIKTVREALPAESDLRTKLEIGATRYKSDGSLYRVEPGELEAKQKDVLGNWQKAASKQADAEATYKIYSDDTASLKQRAEKLKDDAWLEDAKALVEASAS